MACNLGISSLVHRCSMLVSSVQWIKGSWVFVGVVGFVTLYGWFGGAQRLYTYALSMQTYDCIWDCDNIH